MLKKALMSNSILIDKLEKETLKKSEKLKYKVINYISMSESHSSKPWRIEKIIEENKEPIINKNNLNKKIE